MKSEIQCLLDELWSGVILNFSYELLSHRICFNVMVTENAETKLYRIVIDEIYSIIFHDGYAEEKARKGKLDDDKTDYIWDMMEVSSFYYSPILDFEYQICFPSDDGDIVKRKGYFNLLLEIWGTEVYMIAKRLKINDQEFKLL